MQIANFKKTDSGSTSEKSLDDDLARISKFVKQMREANPETKQENKSLANLNIVERIMQGVTTEDIFNENVKQDSYCPKELAKVQRAVILKQLTLNCKKTSDQINRASASANLLNFFKSPLATYLTANLFGSLETSLVQAIKLIKG